MTDLISLGEPEFYAHALEESGEYKVLRRFHPPAAYCTDERPADAPALKRAAIVDVETTGLEDDAKIIELSVLLFEFDLHTGQVHRVIGSYSGLEDPGFPIPPEITELTGIRTEDVAGKTIDDEAVKLMVEDVPLIIAYKAEFDRPLIERRLPLFMEKHWACALEEVDWDLFGARGKKQLDYMLERILGLFCDGHRATEDCEVTLHLLAATPPAFVVGGVEAGSCTASGVHQRTPFQLLLESVQTPIVRLWALDSPFAKKDILKARGYAWSDGKNGRRKGWWIDVAKADGEAEFAFLKNEIYQSPRPNIFVSRITARDRYSNRA